MLEVRAATLYLAVVGPDGGAGHIEEHQFVGIEYGPFRDVVRRGDGEVESRPVLGVGASVGYGGLRVRMPEGGR